MKGYVTEVHIGDVFGNFTVVGVRSVLRGIKSPRHEIKLLCRCALCGSEKLYPKYNIMHGALTTCGCASRTRNGEGDTRLCKIWRGMLRRCGDAKDKSYKYYGGKGVTVCDEWKESYEVFKTWAEANGYKDKLTLDRIDVSGDYCPANCRWVTLLEQANNRSNNRYVTYKDKRMTLSELSRVSGINYSKLSARIKKGQSVEEALENVDRRRTCSHSSIRGPKLYCVQGVWRSIADWAECAGMEKERLRYYMSLCDYDMEKALRRRDYTSTEAWLDDLIFNGALSRGVVRPYYRKYKY